MKLGFSPAKYNASLFYNSRAKVSGLVHGDDFVATGRRWHVQNFRKQISGRFTFEDNIVGSRADLGEVNEAIILNRVLRRTSQGWEYEADQRHAELIIRGMNLENAKAVKTPGEDIPEWKLDEEEAFLDAAQSTQFRMLTARANYLAADRMDIQYAVKECARGMANPQRKHQHMMKRLARYLLGRPRMIWKYQWQGREEIQTYCRIQTGPVAREPRDRLQEE